MNNREGAVSLLNPVGPLLAILACGVAGSTMMTMMPGALAALAQHRQLVATDLAQIAAAEMAGLTCSVLLMSAFVGKLNRHIAAVVASLLLIAGNILSIYVDPTLLMAVRFFSGCSEGLLIAIAASTIAAMVNPDRIFGIYMTVNLCVSSLLLFIVSNLIENNQGGMIFWILAAIASLALIFSRWLPRLSAIVESKVPALGKSELISGAAGLGATFVLFIGVGAVWPLAGQIGLTLGMTAPHVAQSLSFATLAGIVAGLTVALVAGRVGRAVPVLIGTSGLGIALILIALSNNGTMFSGALILLMFFWVFIVPFYTAVVATIDPVGRLASLSMAMQFAGMAVGPMLSAMLIGDGDLDAPIWLAAALCIPALLLILYAVGRSAQSARQAAA